MKYNDLVINGDLNESKSLDKYDFANVFEVINKGEKSYFNLCKVVKFNSDEIDESMVDYYEVLENDTWTIISYKFYKTIKLWWLICKFNEIENPFDKIETGTIIKIPNNDLMNAILSIIKSN